MSGGGRGSSHCEDALLISPVVQSISQTRQHFQNVVLGLEDHAVGVFWPEEWEVPVAERITKDRERAIASPARSAKGKEKVKKRS